jgi:hypothetical protein
LLQGQDAILLLLLYTLAFICMKRNRDASAGSWLALGLFKPHLVLPFLFLLLVQRKTRVLYGFLPIAAGLALVSFGIVGREGIVAYPHYVLHLEDTMARGAILPSDMPNLRGVLYLLLDGDSYRSAVALASSGGVILLAAWQLGTSVDQRCFDLKFSLAAVVTILVSYHAMEYDLSMLMLPILLLANLLLGKSKFVSWPEVLIIAGVAVLFCSPIQLVLLVRSNHLALVGWAVLAIMCGIVGQIAWCARQPGAAL